MRRHDAPRMDLELAGPNGERQTGEEAAHVAPVLVERSLGNGAVHHVVPRAGLVLTRSSGHATGWDGWEGERLRRR